MDQHHTAGGGTTGMSERQGEAGCVQREAVNPAFFCCGERRDDTIGEAGAVRAKRGYAVAGSGAENGAWRARRPRQYRRA
jgi:hypothetical protein